MTSSALSTDAAAAGGIVGVGAEGHRRLRTVCHSWGSHRTDPIFDELEEQRHRFERTAEPAPQRRLQRHAQPQHEAALDTPCGADGLVEQLLRPLSVQRLDRGSALPSGEAAPISELAPR